jgi:cation/acetate symporter
MVLVGKEAIVAGGDKGGNMAALMLANVTGGSGFMGFIAAVAFATILAVVAGLTLSGASTISHDLYVNVVKKGISDEAGEVKIAKRATIALGILSVLLGLAFEGKNVAFMVGLAFSIAASGNFPALLLSILWKNFTTKGAVASMVTGTGLSLLLIILSSTVWVDILGFEEAVFPLKNPALASLPAAFLAGYIFSKIYKEAAAAEKFEEEKIRTYLGVGSE